MSASQTHPTMQMTVGNVGFIVERLGRDCAPLQFVRELTANAIEAVLRTKERSGEVRWEIDEEWTEISKAPKLCITDNGVGMTAEEMMKYVNKLSSSVHMQSHTGNFGIGAKIAAATRNHAGLLYQSWVEAEGAQIHLWRDWTTDQYGLKQYEFEDGTFDHYAGVDEDGKPELISRHGTRVTLLGNSYDYTDDTLAAPPGAARPSRWLTRYLNSRYFEFPEGVRVSAVENWSGSDGQGDDRLVHGMRWFLERHSEARGRVQVDGATVHWWILKPFSERQAMNSVAIEQGHVAALYQAELYELQTGNAGIARLQMFGVTFGHDRVVLYIEPTEQEGLAANTSRTELLINGEPLAWTAWARQFREHFPDELEDLIEQSIPRSSDEYKKAIRERLNAIRDLMKLSRYRRATAGARLVTSGTEVLGTASSGTESFSRDQRPRPVRAPAPPKKVSEIQQLADTGIPAEEIAALNDPKVYWISVLDEPPTRTGGEIEDRAARYLSETNQIHANADFRGFTDMIDRWMERYSHVPACETIVRDTVREWFEQSLVETVIACKSLQHSQYWSADDVEKLLSPEGLTAAVMARYHIDFAVNRALGRKLGSLKEKDANRVA
jgi:Histidine kinase-, DNA gyrase B-, and HSP90-like ATPase